MRKQIVVVALAATLLTTGCVTGYRSADEMLGIAGGFSEIRLAPDSWRVTVQGNGLTTRGQAEAYLMRRCAELTLEQGRRYFVLEDHDAWIQYRRDSEGDVHSRPINEAVVITLKEDNGNAFDAIEVVEETDAVADGRLSPDAQQTIDELKKS